MLSEKDQRYIEKMKGKIAKKQFIIALLLLVGLIIYASNLLYQAVSMLKLKLLQIGSTTQYAEGVSKGLYSCAVLFFILGILLGMLLGVYLLTKKYLKIINKLQK